jgi:hypothetical protein
MGDRARQDWVHEHAETGKLVTPRSRLLPEGLVPPATHELHRARGRQGQHRSPFNGAVRLCRWRRGNGLAPFDPLVDWSMGGHKISASGFALWTARSVSFDDGTQGIAITPP